MLMNLYVFRDCLAEESSSPIMAKNDGVALSIFARTIERESVSGDGFKLLHVGLFDTETSVITVTSIREVELPLALKDPKVACLVDDLMGMKKQ